MNCLRVFRPGLVFVSLILICCIPELVNAQRHPLKFKTHSGHMVKVSHGTISYDARAIFHLEDPDDILDTSRLNRIIEDHGAVFLFLAMDGRPNLDRYNVYKITPLSAKLVADAILSPIKDYDNDGYLEFGGRDLTEGYGSPDSMYYIPTAYYEVRNGTIHQDVKLTIQKDKEINGLYLPPAKQLDVDGNCCVVIADPAHKRKKTSANYSRQFKKTDMPLISAKPLLSKHDTIFLKKRLSPDDNMIYIEKNRDSKFYKNLLNFDLDDQDGKEYIENLHELNKATKHYSKFKLPPFFKQWISIYEYKDSFYSYYPADFGVTNRRMVTDSTICYSNMDGFFLEAIISVTRPDSRTWNFTVRAENGISRHIIIHIINPQTKLAVWEALPDSISKNTRYHLYVPKEYADKYDMIVNYTTGDLPPEFEFDKTDFERLLEKR